MKPGHIVSHPGSCQGEALFANRRVIKVTLVERLHYYPVEAKES